ncbi:MAG TPA: phenylalanine--tRNA ligase subunit alpha [Tepidisphaeraceae bacterium]|jgi:phenylalanyl-tRNA synthetase alpha chain|nr:phenylalanine--tRNA ligase subunit alpha [Tepidisphaeraceae bacterium]
MADVFAQIDALLAGALSELSTVKSPEALEQFRIKYLGSNGLLKGSMKLLGQSPKEQKPVLGQRLNAVKEEITAAFETAKQSQSQDAASDRDYADVTEPGTPLRLGRKHILMKVADELTELFGRMGFAVASGPEMEDEFHNFVALNIPESHPARDPLDNFYLAEEGAGLTVQGSGAGSAADLRSQISTSQSPSALSTQHSALLLRTQTSTVQIRVMENQKPPVRVVIPGRVYRPDTVDATHLFMFHQLEALVVDKNVTMVDLKSTVMQFIHAYFGPQAKARFRPSFFPFTEPSAEVDVWFEDKQRWIELGGCGMVHPNVFKAVGIDPEVYSGWAFGFGIERIAMRKYGIDDIRRFVENDVRFLEQF